MENNHWDLLIYLIIGIISLIGGIYKNAGKKQEAERQRQQKAGIPSSENDSEGFPEGKTKPMDPFEEFIRRQLGQMEEEKPVPAPLKAGPKKVPVNKPALEPTQIEGEASFDTTKRIMNPEKITDESFFEYDQIKSMEEFDYNLLAKGEIHDIDAEPVDFDPKKAIVFSEILNRREF